MSITRRLIDLARSNLTDFREAFDRDDLRESLEVPEPGERDPADSTIGARAGRKARRVRDAAEEAWEKAFDEAQNRVGVGLKRPAPHEIQKWYRTLELEPGAALDDVRRAYRKLLARYHPDRFEREPTKQKAATEVARRLTEAYNGLVHHLGDTP